MIMFKFFSKQWSEFPLNRVKDIKKNPLMVKVKNVKSNILYDQNTLITKDLKTIHNLENLYYYIKNDFVCNLKNTCKNTVIYSGTNQSPLMIIGEAPGAEEDEQELPFVGDSGKLLNNMLKAINIERSKTYVTNIVFWRPPMNRTPNEKEIQKFIPIVKKHIEIYQPKLIFLLGSVALKALFGMNQMITKIRGQLMHYNGIKTLATFHPSYILRLPKQKAIVWQDLQVLQGLIQELTLENCFI